MSSVARDPRLDALRGFALLGILWVNIQSYAYGATNPIGFLPVDAGFADRLAYFLTAAFVAGKFMPLFGMLFGAGFALLYDRLRSSAANPRAVYRRRLVALFVIGMLHGLFLYFGDITHAYAVAGFVLLLYADSDVAATARATARWWLIAGIWTVLLTLSSIVMRPEVTMELVDELNLNVAATVSLGYWEQWPIRAEMFILQLQANLLSLPVLIALMMTGHTRPALRLADRSACAGLDDRSAHRRVGRCAHRRRLWAVVGNACGACCQPPDAGCTDDPADGKPDPRISLCGCVLAARAG